MVVPPDYCKWCYTYSTILLFNQRVHDLHRRGSQNVIIIIIIKKVLTGVMSKIRSLLLVQYYTSKLHLFC